MLASRRYNAELQFPFQKSNAARRYYDQFGIRGGPDEERSLEIDRKRIVLRWNQDGSGGNFA